MSVRLFIRASRLSRQVATGKPQTKLVACVRRHASSGGEKFASQLVAALKKTVWGAFDAPANESKLVKYSFVQFPIGSGDEASYDLAHWACEMLHLDEAVALKSGNLVDGYSDAITGIQIPPLKGNDDYDKANEQWKDATKQLNTLRPDLIRRFHEYKRNSGSSDYATWQEWAQDNDPAKYSQIDEVKHQADMLEARMREIEDQVYTSNDVVVRRKKFKEWKDKTDGGRKTSDALWTSSPNLITTVNDWRSDFNPKTVRTVSFHNESEQLDEAHYTLNAGLLGIFHGSFNADAVFSHNSFYDITITISNMGEFGLTSPSAMSTTFIRDHDTANWWSSQWKAKHDGHGIPFIGNPPSPIQGWKETVCMIKGLEITATFDKDTHEKIKANSESSGSVMGLNIGTMWSAGHSKQVGDKMQYSLKQDPGAPPIVAAVVIGRS